jgi:hypothetical protein
MPASGPASVSFNVGHEARRFIVYIDWYFLGAYAVVHDVFGKSEPNLSKSLMLARCR